MRAQGAAFGAAQTQADGSSCGSGQQIIINFIQTVMAKLGRGSVDSPSHLGVSSRWKLRLLAQALPACAQAQAAGATAASAPATTTSNRYPTLQAARLAADTLSQLAQSELPSEVATGARFPGLPGLPASRIINDDRQEVGMLLGLVSVLIGAVIGIAAWVLAHRRAPVRRAQTAEWIFASPEETAAPRPLAAARTAAKITAAATNPAPVPEVVPLTSAETFARLRLASALAVLYVHKSIDDVTAQISMPIFGMPATELGRLWTRLSSEEEAAPRKKPRAAAIR